MERVLRGFYEEHDAARLDDGELVSDEDEDGEPDGWGRFLQKWSGQEHELLFHLPRKHLSSVTVYSPQREYFAETPRDDL